MVFWILIAVMTAAAALSVLIPLARTKRSSTASAASADEEVYRDQLAAIDSELDRGLIDPEAAEAARTEVARRLLAAHDKNSGAPKTRSEGARLKLAQGLAVLALPVMALGIYFTLGAPDLPDQPLAARLNAPAEEQSVDILVARVERHLADNPEDGQGWAVIAPVYLTLGQPQASANAYANALRILGPRADWLTDMGEALTMANQGLVSANARQAFEQAVGLEPDAIKARFFLAIALGQEGKKDSAIKAWETLLEGADESAAWVHAARQHLAELSGAFTPVAELGGPSTDDIAAAQEMDAGDRQTMISGMVSGLAERLKADGGTPEEWNRLIRAYVVLGERQKAETALTDAQAAYADKPEQLSLIKDAASQLGLTGS